MSFEIPRRPRRNRKSSGIRSMLRETVLAPQDFVYPVFLKEEISSPEEIGSMPGVVRHTMDSLLKKCEEVLAAGIPAVALFPVISPEKKTPEGSYALSEECILYPAIEKLRAEFPELCIITDVALDPFTTHGHDGVLSVKGTDVDNDRTVEILCEMALRQAAAGVSWVAPSDMMDGRVREIRKSLDRAGHEQVSILSYAAKYASAFYGPFRDAVQSKVGKDAISKAGYQMDPGNVREALLEVDLDVEEGADLVMVKPAGPYLDVISAVSARSPVPVAAYQVSGEFAMLHAAAERGWLDLRRARDESLLAIKRAGAKVIFSYFALDFVRGLNE